MLLVEVGFGSEMGLTGKGQSKILGVTEMLLSKDTFLKMYTYLLNTLLVIKCMYVRYTSIKNHRAMLR